MKTSLNFVNTCLRVVDTRRIASFRQLNWMPIAYHVPFASAGNVEVNATSSNSERAHADNDIDIGVPSLQVIDGDLLFSYSLD
jgi:hypothetical protein